MKRVIIRYNAGNVKSVEFALQRLGVEAIISDDPEIIMSADHVILPGVGEASTAMACLKAKGLDKVILNLRQPVLGICLGMQLMCQASDEGNTSCLGIFDQEVKRFPDAGMEFKIPHMGWNSVCHLKSPVFSQVEDREHVYFVHSYYAAPGIFTIALSNYIVDFSSAIQRDNFYGLQFHPEKSGPAGERILSNFLSL
jgi:imidazole glycerol-phosphate synthase subunit HisH